MILLDALSAENCLMIGAIEMLHSLIVMIAKKTLDAALIFKIQISQNMISFNDFV
jgi:hypothetical protein